MWSRTVYDLRGLLAVARYGDPENAIPNDDQACATLLEEEFDTGPGITLRVSAPPDSGEDGYTECFRFIDDYKQKFEDEARQRRME